MYPLPFNQQKTHILFLNMRIIVLAFLFPRKPEHLKHLPSISLIPRNKLHTLHLLLRKEMLTSHHKVALDQRSRSMDC